MRSIAKALIAFYQKYIDEQSKKEIKDILARCDRVLLVTDPRCLWAQEIRVVVVPVLGSRSLTVEARRERNWSFVWNGTTLMDFATLLLNV